MSSSAVTFNVATFLPRLQRQVASGYSLQRTTVDSLNAFLDMICDQVVETMLQLHKKTHKMTVDVKTLQCALNLLFPDSLYKFSLSAGTIAVERYLDNKPVVRTSSDPTDPKLPRVSRSARAGLVFPVSRVIPILKRAADRVQPVAAVFLTAVLEFLATEMIESASESTSSGKRKQISVYDLNRSVWGDRSLQQGSSSSWMSGDAELQKVAQRVKWGSLDRGWKGMYTDSLRPAKRSKKVVTGVVLGL